MVNLILTWNYDEVGPKFFFLGPIVDFNKRNYITSHSNNLNKSRLHSRNSFPLYILSNNSKLEHKHESETSLFYNIFLSFLFRIMISYTNNPFVYTFIFLLSIGNTVAFTSSSLPHAQDPKLVVDEVNRYVKKKKKTEYDQFTF